VSEDENRWAQLHGNRKAGIREETYGIDALAVADEAARDVTGHEYECPFGLMPKGPLWWF
jgi:hypothetical protein